MTNEQWEQLISVINGQTVEPIPVGFIIDSPWLPGWAGISTMDYYANDEKWFRANLKAVQTFPEVIFLPGFWAEFGMCTEPSAFGTKCRWSENDLPFADKIITDIKDIEHLQRPNPRTDGLLPFVTNRLKNYRAQIERAGYGIRFAVSRGPLNIASFLMGTTEFLMAIHTNPSEVHTLLTIVSDFITDWLTLQKEMFPTIDGVFILDDIVGFLGPDDFKVAALPYLREIFQCCDVTVKFFHNDSSGLVCAPFLREIGVNLFNFSFEHPLGQMKELTGNAVTLLGNIPPRDVLANGTPDDVAASVEFMLAGVTDRTRIILSCGGGVPPGVPTRNIEAFVRTAKSVTSKGD